MDETGFEMRAFADVNEPCQLPLSNRSALPAPPRSAFGSSARITIPAGNGESLEEEVDALLVLVTEQHPNLFR